MAEPCELYGFAFVIDERFVRPGLVNLRWGEWFGLGRQTNALVCEDDAAAKAVGSWTPRVLRWCATVGGGCVLVPRDHLRMQVMVAEFLSEHRPWFGRISFGLWRGIERPPYGPDVPWPCEAGAEWRGWSGSRVKAGA